VIFGNKFCISILDSNSSNEIETIGNDNEKPGNDNETAVNSNQEPGHNDQQKPLNDNRLGGAAVNLQRSAPQVRCIKPATTYFMLENN
jgi:hypothetical protein